ncbi:family 43 glycosylhydrolase [Kribbella monticola]|uniref:family 43 glycosylhydrolase n=1 Tax=Kribbella monticola TaxID=2185285 RepID=UPI000DD49B4D|nr:family 43 glycosylhydrolase [Kribbella monticola]
MRSLVRRLPAAGLALISTLALLSAPAAGARSTGEGYSNPVTAGFSADFPDPSMIKGRDGWWYAYSTGGPYAKDGSDGDSYKIARSRDLTHWEKVGPVFDGTNRPTWADPSSGFWAPDIRYLGGRYVLYFTVHNTTTTPDNWDYAIGAATAPTPAGPWTDSGAPVVAPRPAADGGFQWTIDPAEFTDTDGTRYLYWGSYNGGIHAVRLTPDGLKTVGPVTDVARDRFEGPYVVKQGGYYYLFGSSSNCCAGPATGYAVFAGRSKSPLGPFVDRQGASLLASRTGGTPVVASNGNKWVGTGHSSIVTDLAGQQWFAYHAVDRTDPFVTGSNGWLLRPMLLDRLDWIDGWPTVNAGTGPSETSRTAPVTAPLVGPLPADVRVEADLRGSGGVYARRGADGSLVRAVVNARRLVVETVRHGRVIGRREAALAYDAGNVALEVRGNQVTVEASEDRLGDPLAVVSLGLPAGMSRGSAGALGAVDNFSAAALYQPVRRAAPTPYVGKVDSRYSDDFSDGWGSGWTWRNVSPDAVVAGGALTWPTETNDLSSDATAAKASLLLRDQPEGRFVVETKLSLDVGSDTVRNYQQAGLLVYVDDQDWMRLDHVAGGTGRFVEFAKRMRFTPPAAPPIVSFGGAMIGPPAATTWLRLAHDLVPGTGEHRYRAASSTDGKHWVWGAAWTLPAGTTPRIGLVSQGSTAQAEAAYGKASATFDYFRVTR